MEADVLSLEKEEEGEQSLSEGEQDYSVKQVILFKLDLKKKQSLQAFPTLVDCACGGSGWLVLLQRSDPEGHEQWWTVRPWHSLRYLPNPAPYLINGFPLEIDWFHVS